MRREIRPSWSIWWSFDCIFDRRSWVHGWRTDGRMEVVRIWVSPGRGVGTEE